MAAPAAAAPAASPPSWHALTTAAVADRLGSDVVRGLAEQEAARRLAAHGPNALAEPAPVPWWRTLLAQFRELVIWILVAAAVIAGAMGDWADTAAIVAIVLVNAVIGFLQEDRAQRALAALRTMSTPLARVVRDGQRRSIPSRDLVPGDVIEVEAGDHVPADARVAEAFALTCQEAALTGESVPVGKHATDGLAVETPLGDRHTLLHAGTVVATGSGSGVVVATGMDSELGRIAGLLERAPPEPTPLQRRLTALGRILIAVCLVVVGLIFAVELVRGGGLARLVATGGFAELLLRSVSLAVAAVPEGLPAVVTLVLALGLQRMVRRNALVRRLPSVETLGSVTVICSDKTGTLTRNEMTVRDILTAGRHYAVSGVGYDPRGEFRADDGTPPTGDPDLRRLLEIAARCTTATVAPAADGSGWRVVGDPTEGALVVAAIKAGVAADGAAPPTLFELPFDSDRKRMSVVVRGSDGDRLLDTKGAPEAVLPRCAAEQRGGRVVPLTAERRREILAAADGLADRALRVLAFAWRSLPAHETLDGDADGIERELVLVGLAGMLDPPREEAKAAVARCRSAGIRPVMITGDHPATALAVGRELGLASATARAVAGAEIDGLDDAALAAVATDAAVYARVTAEHKLRIVQALQRLGNVVAMTGDGMNDAPAVKAADIGIAMGITGTDVTREAADMVLTDDNFASIVAAVEEGRGIYDNIRTFIHYLLACNAGEVLLMLVAAVAGWPAPLAAIQILWLNLVTDGLPALALGLEPPEHDIMRRPPRPPGEPVIPWRTGATIVLHGALVAAVCVAAFWLAWRGDEARLDHARTVAFCVAAFSQLLFAIGCRSDRLTAVQLGFFGNPALLVAIALSTLLQVAVVTLPPTQPVFEVAAHPGGDWPLVLGLAVIPLAVIEAAKLVVAAPAR
ncbi:MAG: cation-translocating P-type ATPase [Planctomycetaceae bacterium]